MILAFVLLPSRGAFCAAEGLTKNPLATNLTFSDRSSFPLIFKS